MSMISRPITLAFVLMAGVLFTSCANNLSVPASPDVLRIGVSADSPPMISKSGGQHVGLEVDMGRALAAEMGRTAHFVDRSWDRLLPSLQAGEIDIVMSNMTITNQRRIYADFTDPYLQVGKMILVRGKEFGFYQDPKIIALVDKRIGVEPGTTSDAFVQQYCPRAIRVPLSGPDKAIGQLANGKIDVFLSDAPVIWDLSAKGASQGVTMVPTPLQEENLGWAVRRGDTAILSKANATISKWKKNGQLSKMVNRWMPVGG